MHICMTHHPSLITILLSLTLSLICTHTLTHMHTHIITLTQLSSMHHICIHIHIHIQSYKCTLQSTPHILSHSRFRATPVKTQPLHKPSPERRVIHLLFTYFGIYTFITLYSITLHMKSYKSTSQPSAVIISEFDSLLRIPSTR